MLLKSEKFVLGDNSSFAVPRVDDRRIKLRLETSSVNPIQPVHVIRRGVKFVALCAGCIDRERGGLGRRSRRGKEVQGGDAQSDENANGQNESFPRGFFRPD